MPIRCCSLTFRRSSDEMSLRTVGTVRHDTQEEDVMIGVVTLAECANFISNLLQTPALYKINTNTRIRIEHSRPCTSALIRKHIITNTPTCPVKFVYSRFVSGLLVTLVISRLPASCSRLMMSNCEPCRSLFLSKYSLFMITKLPRGLFLTG